MSNPRVSKRVQEVKEVIQNKPDSDIIKVLSYFDNNVGKTIDAFVNDGGKEALSKYQNDTNNNNKTLKDNNNGGESTRTGSPSQRKAKPNQPRKPSTNLNDLVASVINQYTSLSSTPSTPLSASFSPNPITSSNQEPQVLIDSLNRLVSPAESTFSLPASNGESQQHTTFGGYKVTILGVQTNTNSSQSSVAVSTSSSTSSSTSPSSVSVSSSSASSSQFETNRPSLLDLNIPLLKIPGPQRKFNTAYINPNAKPLLEKHQKDLQRQTAQLAKITSSYQDQLAQSRSSLNQTFNQLKQIINERHAQLEKQLVQVGQLGNELLQSRQQKAADLKVLTDNSKHLNDQELADLKADLKHFVSERQLDEEFSKLSLFSSDGLGKLSEGLSSFGGVTQITDQYVKERPSDLSTPVTPLGKKLNSQPESVQNGNLSAKPIQNGANGNKNKSVNKQASLMNGNGNGANHVDDGEGEFIEVKKPQRNRYKQQQGVNGSNAVTNGNGIRR